MDEEITIIDSKARNERIKNFFIDNKKKTYINRFNNISNYNWVFII